MNVEGAAATAVLLGGTGFLGRRAVSELACRGWRVVVLQRGSAAPEQLETSAAYEHWDGQWGSLRQLVQEARPNVVINLAAHFVAEHGPDDIESLVAGNLQVAAFVLEAARLAGVRGVVTAGTFWEQWADGRPVPVNLYAAMKRAGKQLLRYYCDAHGFSSCHVRFSDIYGPDDARRKLFYWLRSAVRTGESLAMSPGHQSIDLVHVSDAARAIALAAGRVARREVAPGTFEDVGAFSGDPRSLRDVVFAYENVVHRPVPVVWGGRPYRDREVMVPFVIPNLAGWATRVDLERGIRDMEEAPGGLLASGKR